MRVLIILSLIGFSVAAQEQAVFGRRESATPEHCRELARALQTTVTRCTFAAWGAAANVWAEDLGKIDYLSTVIDSEGENGQILFDRDSLARKVEAFLDTVRPLTALRETPMLTIERADLRGRRGSIRVHQYIHGIRVRSRPSISLDTVTGRVYRMTGLYWSSDDVSPPSDEWVREDVAVALAVEGVAAEFGAVGQYELRESRLEWDWSAQGLRPQWWLTIGVDRRGYLAVVDALNGETAVSDGMVN
jgi:hypothetical protein